MEAIDGQENVKNVRLHLLETILKNLKTLTVLGLLAFGSSMADANAASPVLTLPKKPVLTLAAARAIAAEAEHDILQRHLAGGIVVLDDGGHTLLSERMDGAQLESNIMAEEKAVTAVMFAATSESFDKTIRGGYTSLVTAKNTMLAGAVPLLVNGQQVGAIGISTPDGAADAPIAEAASHVLDGAK